MTAFKMNADHGTPAFSAGTSLTVAVAGQPNTGKSTVFNKLTGFKQRVGNWPGKTVDRKEGLVERDGSKYRLVDLPGTYGLTPHSLEEEVAVDYLVSGVPDVILAVVNAASLARSMYLVAELMVLDIPMVLVLNMMDVAEQEGWRIDARALSRYCGVPVVPLVGTDRNVDMAPVLEALAEVRPDQGATRRNSPLSPAVQNLVTNGGLEGVPSPAVWMAQKICEGDAKVCARALAHADDRGTATILALKQDADDIYATRQAWIDDACREAAVQIPGHDSPTARWDRVLMHPLWGRLLAMFAIPVACLLGAALGMFTGGMVLMWAMSAGPAIAVAHPGILGALAGKALIPAMGWIAALMSIIAFIYAIFHFLEDTGYLARVAYLMDPLLCRLGVDGKSAIPLLMGLLCNTVAIAGSRVVATRRGRLVTLAMLPFLPCSGQTGVAFLFAFALFPARTAVLVIIGVTGLNILMACLAGRLAAGSLPSGHGVGLVMELPLYHKPNFRTILGGVRARVSTFVRGTAGFILAALVLLWAISYFPDGTIEHSYLYLVGHKLEPLGRLIGLDWRFVVALLSSFAAKETTAGTLAVLFSVSVTDQQSIVQALRSAITPAGALAFIVASNLYLPCLATISALRVEWGSWRTTLALLAAMLGVAMTMALAAYHIGLIIF